MEFSKSRRAICCVACVFSDDRSAPRPGSGARWLWNLVLGVEQDASIAAIAEFVGIKFAEGRNQAVRLPVGFFIFRQVYSFRRCCTDSLEHERDKRKSKHHNAGRAQVAAFVNPTTRSVDVWSEQESRMSNDTNVFPMPAPRYARFSRRLRAMLLDWIIAVIVIFGALLLVTAVRNDNFSRGLGIVVVVAVVLYEPILVSRMGGTLGHYFTKRLDTISLICASSTAAAVAISASQGPVSASSSRECWGFTLS
ncbi:MAG TPA: RDD family protein [Bradyrhizobium sp.]|nr:RDD family protein [Bradyrhizobium sp.]